MHYLPFGFHSGQIKNTISLNSQKVPDRHENCLPGLILSEGKTLTYDYT